jgi:hypothetical protein
VAGLAGDEDVGEEVHLDHAHAGALAALAAASLDVEGEAPGVVAAGLGLGELAKSSRIRSKALV